MITRSFEALKKCNELDHDVLTVILTEFKGVFSSPSSITLSGKDGEAWSLISLLPSHGIIATYLDPSNKKAVVLPTPDSLNTFLFSHMVKRGDSDANN
jgi:hypothetical protein